MTACGYDVIYSLMALGYMPISSGGDVSGYFGEIGVGEWGKG